MREERNTAGLLSKGRNTAGLLGEGRNTTGLLGEERIQYSRSIRYNRRKVWSVSAGNQFKSNNGSEARE